jgi:hypothetical protein
MWIFFRILIIAANVWGIVMYPRNQTNLDWMACVLCSSAISIFLFIWLTMNRSRGYINWSTPYSLEAPFFPMNKYPLRFWFLESLALLLAGAIAVLKDLSLHDGKEAFGATFFFMGLGIGAAVIIWSATVGRKLTATSE